jgi:hypothetical protein
MQKLYYVLFLTLFCETSFSQQGKLIATGGSSNDITLDKLIPVQKGDIVEITTIPLSNKRSFLSKLTKSLGIASVAYDAKNYSGLGSKNGQKNKISPLLPIGAGL